MAVLVLFVMTLVLVKRHSDEGILGVFSAAIGAPGVPGVPTRAILAHDRGQAAGPVSVRRVQRGRGPQSAQVPVRAPQGPR